MLVFIAILSKDYKIIKNFLFKNLDNFKSI